MYIINVAPLQTEEFLYEVLWMADTILNPTWNNLLDNFETWASRRGLLRRLHELERRRFLERSPTPSLERVLQLTESDADIAVGAWDFARINEAYTRYLAVLKQHPGRTTRGDSARKAIRAWIRNEQSAWLEAIELDPLLPTCLCPKDYLGPKAWDARQRAIPEVRRSWEQLEK